MSDANQRLERYAGFVEGVVMRLREGLDDHAANGLRIRRVDMDGMDRLVNVFEREMLQRIRAARLEPLPVVEPEVCKTARSNVIPFRRRS